MHDCTLPTDARTGIRALGIINGRFVWPIAGGSEPAPEPTPEPTPQPKSAPAEVDPIVGLPRPADDAPESEWKTYAQKWEQRAKANIEKAQRLDEIEAANQTELEKEQKAREAAEQRVTAATTRAVRAEIKALAGKFADPEDAVLNLGDLTRFVGDDGEIDDKAIGDEIDAVLTRKPHLAKPEPVATPEPRPGQPSRPTETLRPGAAPAEPQRATNLFDAVGQAFQT